MQLEGERERVREVAAQGTIQSCYRRKERILNSSQIPDSLCKWKREKISVLVSQKEVTGENPNSNDDNKYETEKVF